jgi:Transposase
MWNTLVDLGDRGYDILAAYIAKEKLRELLALARTGPDRHRISGRLFAFYDWCAQIGLPEIERLAATIEQWWPAIEAFLHTGSPTLPVKASTASSNSPPATPTASATPPTNAYAYAAPPPAEPADTSSPPNFEEPSSLGPAPAPLPRRG